MSCQFKLPTPVMIDMSPDQTPDKVTLRLRMCCPEHSPEQAWLDLEMSNHNAISLAVRMKTTAESAPRQNHAWDVARADSRLAQVRTCTKCKLQVRGRNENEQYNDNGLWTKGPIPRCTGRRNDTAN